VSPAVAQAINKIWFGPTPDGSVPDPAANNGFNASLTGSQLWYGYARGTKVADWTYLLGSSMVGLTLQDPKMAGLDSFVNESGNGADGWRSLSYGGLANVLSQGASLQPWFSNIETDNADLSGVQKAGAKILHYHGVNDEAIPVQGSIQYYNRVAALDGGFANTQKYNRLYLVPAMGHCGGIGGADGSASPALTANNVPAPASNQLYTALTQWVENGTAPTQVDIQSADASASGRLCPYPSKAVYNGTGSVTSAASYACK
jgi:feruloyl esterase